MRFRNFIRKALAFIGKVILICIVLSVLGSVISWIAGLLFGSNKS